MFENQTFDRFKPDPPRPLDTQFPIAGHVRTLVCTESYCANHHLGRSTVALVLPDEFDLLWLDLEAPSIKELQAVADEFNFHPLAVEDATQEHQRAKIDQYDNFYFLVLFDVTYNVNTYQVDENEIDFFLGP